MNVVQLFWDLDEIADRDFDELREATLESESEGFERVAQMKVAGVAARALMARNVNSRDNSCAGRGSALRVAFDDSPQISCPGTWQREH